MRYHITAAAATPDNCKPSTKTRTNFARAAVFEEFRPRDAAAVWTRDRDFIVFAAFEKVEDDALAVYAIPIQEMQRATKWGRAMKDLALKIVDAPAR